MTIGICKFCGYEKPLIAAHIIPKSLYPKSENGDRAMKILDTRGDKPVVDLRNGVYDRNLVCRDCEDLFDPLDSYASKFIPSIIKHPILISSDGLRYRELSDHDPARLKLFLLSVLWRAHATERKEFNRVNLGPFANEVKRIIQNRDVVSAVKFPSFLFTFKPHPDPELDFSNIAMSPISRRYEHGRIYEFWLFGCLAWIYVGGTPSGPAFENGSVREGRNLLILEKDPVGSPYQNTIMDTIKKLDLFNSRLPRK